MNYRESSRPSPVLVVRFYPGTSSFRTDIIHLDALGVEHLIHRHESPPGKFGIEEFRAAVKPSLESGIRRAVIDLVEVRWAPSEVIATLILVEAFLREGDVACVVTNPNSRVMSVLTITGLVWHLKVRESMGEAMESLAPESDSASG